MFTCTQSKCLISSLSSFLVLDSMSCSLIFPCFQQEEFDQTIFAYRLRTVDEFKKPFESEESPVRKAGLSLVSIETRMIPCPYKEKWVKDGGDPVEHARSFIPNIRRWSNATFIEGETGFPLCRATPNNKRRMDLLKYAFSF